MMRGPWKRASPQVQVLNPDPVETCNLACNIDRRSDNAMALDRPLRSTLTNNPTLMS